MAEVGDCSTKKTRTGAFTETTLHLGKEQVSIRITYGMSELFLFLCFLNELFSLDASNNEE